MQFLQSAYFTTRVSQRTHEEDYLNFKHKPTHHRSPPRHAQTPEIASSALQDWGAAISTVPLQQELRMLLHLEAEEEITLRHPFPNTPLELEISLFASPIGPCGSPRLLPDPISRCQAPPHAAHPAAPARPSPHPAPGGEAGEGGRPPARRCACAARSQACSLPGAGGAGRGVAALPGCLRLPSARRGSPRSAALGSHHAAAGGRLPPGALPAAPPTRRR